MTIKEIRAKLKLTQKDFANKYNISIRTLQEWEQGRSNPPNYLIQYLNKEFIPSSLKIDNRNIFYVVIKDKFLNCDKIYPIQQKKIRNILNSIMNKENIKKVIVFGSSTNNQCHIGSDVDLYIEMDKNLKAVDKKTIDFDLDLWTNFTVDEHLLNEIESTGVIVYER